VGKIQLQYYKTGGTYSYQWALKGWEVSCAYTRLWRIETRNIYMFSSWSRSKALSRDDSNDDDDDDDDDTDSRLAVSISLANQSVCSFIYNLAQFPCFLTNSRDGADEGPVF
jgi:hypothetical protein